MAQLQTTGITGSLIVTGPGTISNLTASVFGTSSWATNSRTASNGAFAWGSVSYVQGRNLTATTYNCTVTRSVAGLWPVTFTTAPTNASYAVTMNAFSRSSATPTASIGYSINQSTANFTMSFVSVGSLLTTADFTSASFSVFSY